MSFVTSFTKLNGKLSYKSLKKHIYRDRVMDSAHYGCLHSHPRSIYINEQYCHSYCKPHSERLTSKKILVRVFFNFEASADWCAYHGCRTPSKKASYLLK